MRQIILQMLGIFDDIWLSTIKNWYDTYQVAGGVK